MKSDDSDLFVGNFLQKTVITDSFDKEKTSRDELNIGFKVIFIKKVPQIDNGSVKLSLTEFFRGSYNLYAIR
jgi:hypothetical protein